MNSVIKATSYVLAHAPDMVIHNGTTQETERIVNPESSYLKALEAHLRRYEDTLSYLPNQVYIGNITPDALAATEQPWFDKKAPTRARSGPFGEIMPQDELYLLLGVCDVFDLVRLEKSFVAETRARFIAGAAVTPEMAARVSEGFEQQEIDRLVAEEGAQGLYLDGQLVGCVRRAHDVDLALSAHVLLENIVSKAGSVLALRHLILNAKIDAAQIDYVIDCCEEACGDMNQRGGGNFAKAAAEIAGFINATGSDTRSFCAGPAHAIVEAAALVGSGAYRNVVVTAGGCTAKLGMNGKDHVKKGMPILEDMLAGFAVLISENDGVSPEINLGILGRHTVGTGSSPQAVITALVAAPLERNGMKICDIDRYSAEMQNPDITKPAGAGDVPLANYKMIGALAVKQGELSRDALAEFPARHGMAGWAPTQGHIPSGVPYLGFARNDILSGRIKRAMIIGKGSLFLGRMTNLFDGVSVVIQANTACVAQEKQAQGVSEQAIRAMIAEALRDFASGLLQKEG